MLLVYPTSSPFRFFFVIDLCRQVIQITMTTCLVKMRILHLDEFIQMMNRQLMWLVCVCLIRIRILELYSLSLSKQF